jgi:hypothetical protein
MSILHGHDHLRSTRHSRRGKKRDVNTPEVNQALDLLEPYIRPACLIAQFTIMFLANDRLALKFNETQDFNGKMRFIDYGGS